MDLLRPVDIYEHRSEHPVLHATFPEEFRYLTEPPLPDTKVKLTSVFHDDLENAFYDNIIFEAIIGIASQKTNEMFENRTVTDGDRFRWIEPEQSELESLELALELDHFTLSFTLNQGRLEVSIQIWYESVTPSWAQANAPEFVNETVKYVLREYGHRNAVEFLYEPTIGPARRREGAGLGVELEFYMYPVWHVRAPLKLKKRLRAKAFTHLVMANFQSSTRKTNSTF